jgi:hypothetical protein
MTWTYDSTSIITDLAKVRLTAGLTDTNDQLLTDEEIAYQLSLTSNITRAAAECLRLALRSPKVARAVDRTGTGFSASRSQRYTQLKELLVDLDARAGGETTVAVDFGSASVVDTIESDTDYTPAAFKRDLFTNDG